MRRTMSIWVVIAACACIVAGFFWYNNSLTDTIQELDAAYDDGKVRLAELQEEQTNLNEMLEAAGTDAFIENQARTLYGYMMPDEIRFVITNPEVLYGDEEIPSR